MEPRKRLLFSLSDPYRLMRDGDASCRSFGWDSVDAGGRAAMLADAHAGGSVCLLAGPGRLGRRVGSRPCSPCSWPNAGLCSGALWGNSTQAVSIVLSTSCLPSRIEPASVFDPYQLQLLALICCALCRSLPLLRLVHLCSSASTATSHRHGTARHCRLPLQVKQVSSQVRSSQARSRPDHKVQNIANRVQVQVQPRSTRGNGGATFKPS